MANVTADAANAAKAKAALVKVLRQRNNENTAKFFAAGMCGMIIIFMLFHWTRYAYKKYESKKGKPAVLNGPVAITRLARRFLMRKVSGFTSTGHALIFVGWFATCLSIAFVNIDWSTLNGWARRLGWVAVSNIALITFLALKNTPLAFLTAYSYERLNILHQVAGYGTVFWTMMHMVVYTTAWAKSRDLDGLLEETQLVGIVAGVAMLVILATALLLRKLTYEIFYIVHITMFMLIIVMVGMHRPDFGKHTVIIVIFTACIWVADRLLRFAKISIFSFGNTATITPLPHGGTRIVLRKSSGRAVAGSHAFLWIPAIRASETHPFTIVSTKPLEFVVAAYDGFTRDLHSYALKNPGKALKASIDGPYGNVPNFADFSKVVFIAGGSGASFIVGAALDLVRKLGDSRRTAIEFIWAMRDQDCIQWFAKELQELQSSPLVNITIHSTQAAPVTSRSSISSMRGGIEKTPLPTANGSSSSTTSKYSSDLDIEKRLPSSTATPSDTQLEIKTGRPDVTALVTEIVNNSERSDRIAVAACGPDSLMQITRQTAVDCIRVDGPSVELFLEQFEW